MPLNGVFSPPGDKSISHRLALLSLLAQGECRLRNFSSCADVCSSLEAVGLLGGRFQTRGEELLLGGAAGRLKDQARIDCGNSGTTMRLLMGLLAGRNGKFILDGDGSLRRRPMERVAAPLRRMGAEVDCSGGGSPVTIVGGRLQGLEYRLPAPSAQLKSAVLLAGLQADGLTRVRERQASRDHTERFVALFGGRVFRFADGWGVKRSDLILPESLWVPGDCSSAAFFLCAAAIIPGSEVTAEGVLLNPTRTGFLKVLARMGARVEVEVVKERPEPWGRVKVRSGAGLGGCRVEAREIASLVDEVPVLALVATQARGQTRFEQVGELRLKESDRLTAIAEELGRMGAKVAIEGEALVVEGPTPLRAPERLACFGDHRVAMTLRLAGLAAGTEPLIEGEESIGVSYPGFYADLRSLWQ